MLQCDTQLTDLALYVVKYKDTLLEVQHTGLLGSGVQKVLP